METKSEELAALYVLDLLEGEEKESFERRLSEEDQLAELVRELSTGLHAPLKQYNAPERMDLLAGIQQKIGIAPQEEEPVLQTPRIGPASPGFRWMQGLGVAAALLLALNLYQYFDPQVSRLESELQASRLAEQALREENSTIKAFNESWESEYRNLAERMLPFIASRDGHGEFTVIDLVGIQSDKGSSTASSGDVGDYIISQSPLQFASVNQAALPEEKRQASMGYAVWKSDEQMGYLDLYNLSEAGPDRAPFLWLREAQGDPFVPVGYLPVLDNGTGTFYFEVDQQDFQPREVLITEESLDGYGDKPSSHRLMVGP